MFPVEADILLRPTSSTPDVRHTNPPIQRHGKSKNYFEGAKIRIAMKIGEYLQKHEYLTG
jgi:hypothetical protein